MEAPSSPAASLASTPDLSVNTNSSKVKTALNCLAVAGLCSHRRAVYYYLHSIWEPALFPARACASVEECNMEVVEDAEVVAYMGEAAPEYYAG